MKIMSFLAAAVMSAAALTHSAVAADVPSVSAKAAVVIDSLTGEVLYEHNSRTELPMASTTKIMSALIALESGSLDESFVVDSDAIKVEGSSMGLQEGSRVTMRDLVHGMLLPSGNDAANAAAVRISGTVEAFVERMNSRAAEMGLEQTHFVTPSGLDDHTDEHYSTAYDMAVLTREALKNQDFREICGKKTAQLTFGDPPESRWLTNTNKLLTMCDGVIGVKTGFTDKARRCLVSACERDGATLICVTLNDPDDWQDHSNLYDHAFTKMVRQRLTAPFGELDINVVGAASESVKCRADSAVLTLPEGADKKVECKVYTRPFVYAPCAEGTAIGKADYYVNGVLAASRPVRTAEPCERKTVKKDKQGPFELLFDKLRSLFAV